MLPNTFEMNNSSSSNNNRDADVAAPIALADDDNSNDPLSFLATMAVVAPTLDNSHSNSTDTLGFPTNNNNNNLMNTSTDATAGTSGEDNDDEDDQDDDDVEEDDEAAEAATTTQKDSVNDDEEKTETLAPDQEIQELMVAVNEELENKLVDIKTSTKRLFLGLKQLADTTAQVHAEWEPILQAERAEARRLDELQNEVDRSVFGGVAGGGGEGHGQ